MEYLQMFLIFICPQNWTVWASPERHLIILVISGINPRDFFITRVKERLNKETDAMNIQTFRSSFVFLCCHRHSVISVVGCLWWHQQPLDTFWMGFCRGLLNLYSDLELTKPHPLGQHSIPLVFNRIIGVWLVVWEARYQGSQQNT